MSCRILGVALCAALFSFHVAAAAGAEPEVAKPSVSASSKAGVAKKSEVTPASATAVKKTSATSKATGRVAKPGMVYSPSASKSRSASSATTAARTASAPRSKPRSVPSYTASSQTASKVARTRTPVRITQPADRYDDATEFEAAAVQYEDILTPGDGVVYEHAYDDYSCESCGDLCMGDRCYRQRTWVRNEYILWWTKSSIFPPLATTAPAGTAQNLAGIVGQPTTTTLFGGDRNDFDARSGGRLTFGYWMDDCHVIGFEGGFFALGDGSVAFDADSGGDPILARPFFDIGAQTEAAQIIAFPGVSNGGLRIESDSEVAGAEANVRHLFSRNCNRRIDLVMGYRFARFDDGLRISDTLTSISTGGTVPVGTVITGFDDFSTTNEFHGGQLGLIGEVRNCRWSIVMTGKLGLGNMHQIVHIDGATSVFDPVTSIRRFTDGGLLAQPTNRGDFSRDRFAVIPEFGVNLRYDLSKRMRLTAGYTFIYFNRVVRPDDQIDRSINTTQISGILTGEARPAVTFAETDYWLQGLNFGFEFWW